MLGIGVEIRSKGWTAASLRRRQWILVGCVTVLVSIAAPRARGSIRVADPSSFPVATQHARITALFDGSPISGVSAEVRKFGNGNAIVTLTTDSKGQIILPALPDGPYQIVAWSTQHPGSSGALDLCVGACRGSLAVTELTATDLNGEVKPVEEAARISELSIELGPFQFPPRGQLIAEAEAQSTIRNLRELRGNVVDPSGASIPGAWISVIRHGKRRDQEIALLRSDDKGEFAATLPEGRYIVLVAAQAFESQAVSIAILPTGTPGPLRIALTPGPVY